MADNSNYASSELNQTKAARAVSLFTFIFACSVSVIIFFQNDQLEAFDWILMIGSPIAMSTFVYFVVKHHDPIASD
jgi:hypothetical protein